MPSPQKRRSGLPPPPRVQILDNWGMCNGSCPDSVGGGKKKDSFCMNQDLGLNTLGKPDETGHNDCIDLTYTDSSGEHVYQFPSSSDPTQMITPWTAFGGDVVIPAQNVLGY